MNAYSGLEEAGRKCVSSQSEKEHDSIPGLPISAKSQILVNILGSR